MIDYEKAGGHNAQVRYTSTHRWSTKGHHVVVESHVSYAEVEYAVVADTRAIS